jgi:DoxX-like family
MNDPTTAVVILTVATALANAGMTIADVAQAPFVVGNAAAVRVPPTWLPVLAVLKGAGAVGLVVGLLWLPTVGIAAAAGLTLFFVGAIIAHARAGVWHNIAFPAAYLALATTTLVLAI